MSAGPAGSGAGRAGWDLAHRHLYLCTPDRPDLATFVDACILGGVDVVQLREKHLGDAELVARARVVRKVCADRGVPFVLNDRPDLAVEAGADGVHVGQEDVPPSEARRVMGPHALVGLSTHAADELAAALGEVSADRPPVDYLSAGPVVPTPTKPGRPGTGLGYVRAATRRSPWPVWVTGGVEPATVPGIAEAGARHFVVVRWLTGAADPRASARALRDAVDRALETSGPQGPPNP